MRESLCAAIDAEPDLNTLHTSALNANTFHLAVSSEHDILFLVDKPDIILLALGNPGQSDLLALSSLREKLLDTPILALTRDEVPGQEQAALQYGAHKVPKKTASRGELLHTLRSIRATIALL